MVLYIVVKINDLIQLLSDEVEHDHHSLINTIIIFIHLKRGMIFLIPQFGIINHSNLLEVVAMEYAYIIKVIAGGGGGLYLS